MRVKNGIGNALIVNTSPDGKMSQAEFDRIIFVSLVSGLVSVGLTLVGQAIKGAQNER